MIDSKTLPDVEGFTLRAVLLPDTDASPTDYDCYSRAAIKAWRSDQWSYVGLVVTVSRCGVELASASLWGMEYGSLPGVDAFVNPLSDSDTHGIETIADLTGDAIAQAREKLAELAR